MKRWTRALCAILGLGLLLALTGCWSGVELNQLALVMGMAIDKAPEGAGYHITAQIARPHMLHGDISDGSGDDRAYLNVVEDSDTVYSAMQKLSYQSSRKMYTQQCSLMLLGEDVAREDVTPILEYFLRAGEGQMTMPLMVARGTASAVFEEVTYLEPLPVLHISRMDEGQELTGEVGTTTVFNFISDLLGATTEPAVPIVEVFINNQGDPKARLAGTAIFRRNRWVGEFDFDQGQGMLMIQNKLQQGRITVDWDDGIVDLQLVESKTRVTPIYENGGFRAEVRVVQKYALMNATTKRQIDEIQEEVELTQRIREVEIGKMQSALDLAQSLGADVFGLGRTLRRAFPEPFKAVEENWPEAFARLPVTFEMDLMITGTGSALHAIDPYGARLTPEERNQKEQP